MRLWHQEAEATQDSFHGQDDTQSGSLVNISGARGICLVLGKIVPLHLEPGFPFTTPHFPTLKEFLPILPTQKRAIQNHGCFLGRRFLSHGNTVKLAQRKKRVSKIRIRGGGGKGAFVRLGRKGKKTKSDGMAASQKNSLGETFYLIRALHHSTTHNHFLPFRHLFPPPERRLTCCALVGQAFFHKLGAGKKD